MGPLRYAVVLHSEDVRIWEILMMRWVSRNIMNKLNSKQARRDALALKVDQIEDAVAVPSILGYGARRECTGDALGLRLRT